MKIRLDGLECETGTLLRTGCQDQDIPPTCKAFIRSADIQCCTFTDTSHLITQTHFKDDSMSFKIFCCACDRFRSWTLTRQTVNLVGFKTPGTSNNTRRLSESETSQQIERVFMIFESLSISDPPKQPPTPPQHTHTHPVSSWTTEAAMGIWECGRGGIGIRLQELKESGCVWNFGSCLSPHIPHYSPNNKLCHSRYNSLPSGYLAPQRASNHPKPHTNLQNSGVIIRLYS